MAAKRALRFDVKMFLAKIGAGRALVQCRKGERIFAQGAPADAVFFVQSGRVKLTVVSHRGKAAIVGMLGVGDFLGEGCLAGQPCRIASASAITDAALLRIDKPGPGVAALGTCNFGGQTMVALNLYLYGDQAAENVARERPLWQAWIHERFPMPAETS